MLRSLTDMTEILIVEDERVTAWDLQESLEDLGYQISGNTGSGQQAIALASRTRPNLVMMDIRLIDEDIDGITAAGRIRRELGIPVVYLTAHADDQTLNRALETQPFGYLIKPFNMVELRTTIETALHRYRLEQQLDESQQWFATTLNSLGDGAIATDAVGRVQFMNPSAEVLTGWLQVEAIGRPAGEILRLIHPSTRAPIPPPFAESINQESCVRLPHPCIQNSRDGTERYISDSTAPILSSGAELLGSVLVFQDVTERVLEEQATFRRAQQEQILRTVTDRIRQSLSLETILKTTVDEVRHVLGVERVVIYQFNPNLSGSVTAESLESGIIPMEGILLTDPCLTIEPCISKYRQPCVQALDDVHAANLESCYVELLDRFAIKANLVVSIIVDEATPWGLLAAQHCSAPRPWTADEQNLLLQLSTQISVAIHQSRLYQRLQQTTQALETQVEERTAQLQASTQYKALLNEITDKIWQQLDEQHIIQTTAQELCEHLEAKFCAISFDPSPENLQEGVLRGEFRREIDLDEFHFHLSEVPGLWEQLQQGQPSHICLKIAQRSFCALVYLLQDTYRQDSNPESASPQSQLHPLWGEVVVLKDAEQAFSDTNIQLVQQVSHQCAIAIRQSRLYRAAQSQVEELARLNQLKDDFLSTVSHELRTPMANIRMATQMLEICLQRLDVLDSTQISSAQNNIENYFTVLKQESQREINLIDDLLNLSRLEAGIEELNPILVDLKLWVIHIVERFTERAQQHKQTLSINLPETLPLVEADLACLERLVTELLTNACKYTPAGEQIRISAVVQTPWLDLHVTNTGVEIPASEQSQIFEKFYRIPKSDRWKHGGTGLGLALSQKLAEVLGGYLLMTSNPQETTFTLRLPIPETPSLLA